MVLFSHGLGGTRLAGKVWGEHWASHGYLSIHLQHPGSDAAVAKAAVRGEGRDAVAGALTPRAFAERVQDVRFVLDLIERAPVRIHRAAARADPKRIGMSGHSYGARTTLALAGERVPFAAGEHADARVVAAIAFSPYAPPPPESWPRRFGAIRMPVLSVTGTEDRDVVGGNSAEVRREPFRHMPPGGKYLLVLGGADHMTFNGHDRGGAVDDAAIHARVKAYTLAFWHAHLNADAEARAWLAAEAQRTPAGSAAGFFAR